jgi:hypothetical protein
MSQAPASHHATLDRYTRISELSDALHRMLRTGIPIITAIILLLVLKLFLTNASGWLSLLCIGAGTCLALVAWQSGGIGLPLLPLVAIQHFVVYGIPIVNRTETVVSYPESLIDEGGVEVFTMLVAAVVAWRIGMQVFRPGKPIAHTMRVFATEGNYVLNRIGIALISVATGYELLNSLHVVNLILDVFPGGTQSIVVAIILAASMSGYFLVAMFVASGAAHPTTRVTFWTLLTMHLVLLTSSLLLSSVINIIGAVVIGLFWGSGRTPRAFLLVSTAAL